jgi:predicted transcriptional regulator
MSTLLELAAQIVHAHSTATPMSEDELLKHFQRVYAELKTLEISAVNDCRSVQQTGNYH